MIVFVSYARQDNDVESLRRIERQVAMLGHPYLDDLHNHGWRDRQETVERALRAAEMFVAVLSPNYLRTVWTRKEYEFALCHELPLLALCSDGIFVNRSASLWSWEMLMNTISYRPKG